VASEKVKVIVAGDASGAGVLRLATLQTFGACGMGRAAWTERAHGPFPCGAYGSYVGSQLPWASVRLGKFRAIALGVSAESYLLLASAR
jgi:hypothetical protein